MPQYLPILIVGAIIGTFAAGFLIAYALMKNKKEAVGFDRNMKDGEILRRLIHYAYPYRYRFFWMLLLVLLSIATNLVSPLIVGEIQGMIKSDFLLSDLFVLIGVYGGVLLLSLGCSYVMSVTLQKLGQRIVSALREDLFARIEGLSHGQLNAIPVGTLVTRVTNDTHGLSRLFTNIGVELVKSVFLISGTLFFMFSVNYILTLIVLCFVPFVVLFTLIFRRFARQAHRRVKDGTTRINTYLSENLSGIKVTQIFGAEERKMQEFSTHARTLASAKYRQIFVFGIFRPMVYMLYISSVLFLFFFGVKGHLDGWTVAGAPIVSETIVVFYMYIEKFFNPIQSLAEQFNALQWAFASAEKIFTVMDYEPQVADAPDAVELTEVRGEIEFRDVWFAYKEDEWVLRGVSFHIRAGQTVAFVGDTGSGKTTILSLICRNYDIQRGEILIDGINVKNIKISSLRRAIGQMLQDVFLFSGTVRSNITLGEEFSD